MIRYLTVDEVIGIHAAQIADTGGSPGMSDRGLLCSAVARPQTAFGGEECYPSLIEKAAALAHSLTKNHAFRDGNKRAALASMVLFLRLNGILFVADARETESAFLRLASGATTLEDLTTWTAERCELLRLSGPTTTL